MLTRELGNKYWNIGTNVSKYINNYLNYLSHVNIGELLIVDDLNILNNANEKLISFNSKATLMQNLIVWEAFDFVHKTNNTLVILINNLSEEQLLERAKYAILTNSKDMVINRLKDSIILRLLAHYNVDVIDKFHLSKIKNSKSKNINLNEIKKHVGSFEKYLLQDYQYINFIKNRWAKE